MFDTNADLAGEPQRRWRGAHFAMSTLAPRILRHLGDMARADELEALAQEVDRNVIMAAMLLRKTSADDPKLSTEAVWRHVAHAIFDADASQHELPGAFDVARHLTWLVVEGIASGALDWDDAFAAAEAMLATE